MQPQSSVFIAEGIAISGLFVFLAALVIAFSPMLWSDHWVVPYQTPVPSGCSVLTTPLAGGVVTVAHCPFWVKYS